MDDKNRTQQGRPEQEQNTFIPESEDRIKNADNKTVDENPQEGRKWDNYRTRTLSSDPETPGNEKEEG